MIRPVSVILAICAALALPVSAMADKPAHAEGHGRKAVKSERRAEKRAPARSSGVPAPVKPTPVGAAGCPPGLAKKTPACIPPGQAKKGMVGSVVDWDDIHVITRPGLYGLGAAPAGQRYAVVDGGWFGSMRKPAASCLCCGLSMRSSTDAFRTGCQTSRALGGRFVSDRADRPAKALRAGGHPNLFAA